MAYIDGFILAVPTTNRDAYRKHASDASVMFHEHGALRVVEGWGDDVPHGKLTDFPMAVKAQADETVVLGWIEWPSKEVRDAGWAKVMADPRMQPGSNPMPFDGQRMIYGGFDMLLDAKP